jgi:hypothetical protein
MKFNYRVCFYDLNENLLDEVIMVTRFVEDALGMAVKTDNYLKLEGKVVLISILDPQEEIPLSPPLLELSPEDIKDYLKDVNSKVKEPLEDEIGLK